MLGLCERLEVIGSYAFQNQPYQHKGPTERQPGEAGRAQSGVPYCSIARRRLQKRSRMTTWVDALFPFFCERAMSLRHSLCDALLHGCERALPLALPAGWASRPPDPLQVMLAARTSHLHMLTVCQNMQ